MLNYSYIQSYNYCTDGNNCTAVSSYANNYNAIAMDIALLAISIFVIALISIVSIIYAIILILVLLVILSIIRAGRKQSTKSTIYPFVILT